MMAATSIVFVEARQPISPDSTLLKNKQIWQQFFSPSDFEPHIYTKIYTEY